jgi:hypothetical protein
MEKIVYVSQNGLIIQDRAIRKYFVSFKDKDLNKLFFTLHEALTVLQSLEKQIEGSK